MHAETQGVIEVPEMRNRTRIFKSRTHAGRVLAGLLKPYCPHECVIFAIPSGGVPIGMEISAGLNLPLEIAVVSKITLPWNTEAGYGAVAFNGTVKLNNGLISRLRLSDSQIRDGIESTLEKVQRRVGQFRGERPLPDIAGKIAVLVDDGIASGFTLLTGIDALRSMRPAGVFAASPTGNLDSVLKIATEADLVFCANIRSGRTFAVADAYEEWADIEESQAVRMFTEFQRERSVKTGET
jgi:predicted phosphoribosyltransferase